MEELIFLMHKFDAALATLQIACKMQWVAEI